jgi:hypothetical protein
VIGKLVDSLEYLASQQRLLSEKQAVEVADLQRQFVDNQDEQIELGDIPYEQYAREPSITSEDLAEDSLTHLFYWRDRLEEKQAHAVRQLAKIKLWLSEQEDEIQKKIDWHEEGLRIFLANHGDQTQKLINGTIGKRAGSARVDITDEIEFFEWLKEQEGQAHLRRIVATPDKKEIMTYIKTSGEIPPGTSHEVGPDTLSIKKPKK